MLEQMRARLRSAVDLPAAVYRILDDVIALHGAEYGDLQLLAKDRLVMVAQRGFAPTFVRAMRYVRRDAGTVCARALRNGCSLVVNDVRADRDFAPYLAPKYGIRFLAVQSTPLIAADGERIGVVSTHFANVHEPSPIEMQILAQYGRSAADHLQELRGAAVSPHADRLSSALLAASGGGGRGQRSIASLDR
jgi:GAF domain-containing protein